jgi:hypothetical protein
MERVSISSRALRAANFFLHAAAPANETRRGGSKQPRLGGGAGAGPLEASARLVLGGRQRGGGGGRWVPLELGQLRLQGSVRLLQRGELRAELLQLLGRRAARGARLLQGGQLDARLLPLLGGRGDRGRVRRLQGGVLGAQLLQLLGGRTGLGGVCRLQGRVLGAQCPQLFAACV